MDNNSFKDTILIKEATHTVGYRNIKHDFGIY